MTNSLKSWIDVSGRAALVAAGALTIASSGLPVAAQIDYGYGDYQPITNGQFFANSHQSPEILMFQAEYMVKVGNYRAASKLIQDSLDENDDDIDAHKVLALCLEHDYKGQSDKDPRLLEKCVKEWLIVMRNERGFEKGTNMPNGRGNMIGNRYGDEDMQLLAKQHLKKLVGRPPKNSETDTKYLADVLTPAEESVSGKLMKKKQPDRRIQEAGKGEFEPDPNAL